MSHQNGLITAPVELTDDVKTVLGENTDDLGELCRSSEINIWSKHKPVKYANDFPERNPISEASAWWKAYNYNCGINISVYTDLISMITAWRGKAPNYGWTDFWQYDPPSGGTYPFRLYDFGGYKHRSFNPDSDKPFPGYNMQSEIYRVVMDNEEMIELIPSIYRRTENNAYLLSFDDIKVKTGLSYVDLTDMYFSIAIVWGSGSDIRYAFQSSYYKFNELPFEVDGQMMDGSYGYTIRQLPSISVHSMPYNTQYLVFPFLSSVRMWDNGLYVGSSAQMQSNPVNLTNRDSFPGVFVPLPYNGMEVSVSPRPPQILLDARVYQTRDDAIGINITARNVTESIVPMRWDYITVHMTIFWKNSSGELDYENRRYEFIHHFSGNEISLQPSGQQGDSSNQFPLIRGFANTDANDFFRYGGYVTDIYAESSYNYIQTPVYVQSFDWIIDEIPTDARISIGNTLYEEGDTATLILGETYSLSYTVEPNGATGFYHEWTKDSYNNDVISLNAVAGTINAEGLGYDYINLRLYSNNNDSLLVYKWIRVNVSDSGGGSGGTDVVHVTGVGLAPDYINLLVGRTGSFSVTIEPSNASNKTVYWSSDDNSVATVDSTSGVITGIGIGSTLIQVRTEDGNYTQKKWVYVEQPSDTGNVPVSGVTLNHGSLSINVGGQDTLEATVLPSNASIKAVTWSSSNEGVATVDNGVVTGVSVGSATITVTTKSGGKTATCSVSVTSSGGGGTTVHVSSISLPASKTVHVGYNIQLSPTILPSNASDKRVNWESGNTSIATVSNGKVTGVSVGQCNVTATTVDGNKKATCAIKVEKYVSTVTVNPHTLDLVLGGNPSSGNITVTVTPNDATNKTIKLTSTNESVATVQSNGLVIAKGIGTCDISAKSTDGSNKEDFCQVTVTEDSSSTSHVPVRGVSILDSQGIVRSKETIELNTSYHRSEQLGLSLNPSNATDYTVTWSSRNEGVATVTAEGLVSVVGTGDATIDCAVNGYNNSYATDYVYVHVT